MSLSGSLYWLITNLGVPLAVVGIWFVLWFQIAIIPIIFWMLFGCLIIAFLVFAKRQWHFNIPLNYAVPAVVMGCFIAGSFAMFVQFGLIPQSMAGFLVNPSAP